MDVFTKKKRSEVMARIRGRGNRSTERRFAAILRARRISGWCLHSSQVAGHPDVFFPRHQLAIFVDGCFWHGCKECFRSPAQNRSFWMRKILENVRRDRRIDRYLRRRGISVMRVWEHDLERRTSKVGILLGWIEQKLKRKFVPDR